MLWNPEKTWQNIGFPCCKTIVVGNHSFRLEQKHLLDLRMCGETCLEKIWRYLTEFDRSPTCKMAQWWTFLAFFILFSIDQSWWNRYNIHTKWEQTTNLPRDILVISSNNNNNHHLMFHNSVCLTNLAKFNLIQNRTRRQRKQRDPSSKCYDNCVQLPDFSLPSRISL